MRTLIITLGGLVVWAVCLGIAKFLANSSATSINIATTAFGTIWFLIAAANMWMGVAQAGYSIKEELPIIFLLIFLLPVTAAIFVKWKFF
ncbi:hypothetical protein [Candidatus Nitrotoga sp. AM1P]|uniref:hypothetical protein n=1 Tax=Candidatus Nitrotoga sp. AM1P TaxID=2559597 RepID=UPI0010B81210|nr:hypothetical protein [Candidatus Nitrotoga sp. AM1P]BBJ23862.1 hypothetical protein W01_17890 [Candidatus Nitrotoga sp. AM1P]